MTRRRGETTRKMTTLGLLAAATFGGAIATARPASAQDIERVLAGIRLNSKSSNVLAKYGNPNEVVIGDVGFRGIQAGNTGGSGAPPADGGGLPGLGGGTGGPPQVLTPGRAGGGFSSGGAAAGGFGRGGGPPVPGGAPAGGFGAPSGAPIPGGGGGFGAPAGDGGDFGKPGGFGQPGGFGGGGLGDAGSTSGSIGPFGQNVSTLARQQEVTWIYNRKVNNNLVTYNFLIGANGNVVQIMVTGYKGGNSRTKRNIALGSTYKDVVALYGYPESQSIVGRTLVASYRTRAHVEFQFLPETPQSNPLATGNKCIAITIATVE